MNLRFSTSAFSIVIGMVITSFVVIIGIYLLDRIVPASKNMKWVEFSNSAYYSALSAKETALLWLSGATAGTEITGTGGNTSSGLLYTVSASGTAIPKWWEGNSAFDADWNRIGPIDPIVLQLPTGIDFNQLKIQFRVPSTGWNITLSGGSTPILAWILSSGQNFLFAQTGSQFTADDINATSNDWNFGLASNKGNDLNGTISDFVSYYNSNCVSGVLCLVKIFTVSPLQSDSDGANISYLEYKISGSNVPIPYQYATVYGSGHAYGFQRTINRTFPQITTTSSPFNFTVFQ